MRASLLNRGIGLKHMAHGFPVSGCVVSKEDHGVVMNCGLSGVSFFLPHTAIPQALGELPIGNI